MKILKTDSYISEKLSIRPVTKDMLAGVPKYKMFKTPYDMKQNFKTGDIAIFSSLMGNESAMFVMIICQTSIRLLDTVCRKTNTHSQMAYS